MCVGNRLDGKKLGSFISRFDQIPAKFVSNKPRSSNNNAINNFIFHNLRSDCKRTLCTSKQRKIIRKNTKYHCKQTALEVLDSQ